MTKNIWLPLSLVAQCALGTSLVQVVFWGSNLTPIYLLIDSGHGTSAASCEDVNLSVQSCWKEGGAVDENLWPRLQG